jgi:hypothetical protein
LFFRRQVRPAFFCLTAADTNKVCLAAARTFLSEILALHFSRSAHCPLPLAHGAIDPQTKSLFLTA